MSAPHQWNVASDFCDVCGAARVEVVDGLRPDCNLITDPATGRRAPLVTFGKPGGRRLAEIFFKPGQKT